MKQTWDKIRDPLPPLTAGRVDLTGDMMYYNAPECHTQQKERTMPPAAAENLRQMKKTHTREKLVRAAMELFTAKGFEATTVDEISAATGVSRRTIFRYFPSKELLAFPHIETHHAQFHDTLFAGAADEHPFDAIRRTCLAMALEYMREYDVHLGLQGVIRASPILMGRAAEFDRVYETSMAQKLIRQAPHDPEHARRSRLVAGAVMGAIRATMLEWYDGECREDLVKMAQEALSLIESGLRHTVDTTDTQHVAW